MLEGPILPDRVRTARRMLQQSIGDHGALTFLELELAKSGNKACKYLVPFDSNDRAIRTNSGPPYISSRYHLRPERRGLYRSLQNVIDCAMQKCLRHVVLTRQPSDADALDVSSRDATDDRDLAASCLLIRALSLLLKDI